MIFDSQEQKMFYIKVLRSYVCPYSESLEINQKYASQLEQAAVAPPIQQQAWLNPPKPKPTEVTPPAELASKGNGKVPNVQEALDQLKQDSDSKHAEEQTEKDQCEDHTEESLPEVQEGMKIQDKRSGK